MEKIDKLRERFSLIDKMSAGGEVFWINTKNGDFLSDITAEEIKQASDRLTRFAPYFKKAFPETGDGIIESPLTEIPNMKAALEADCGEALNGTLYLKRDCDLPISGSIKARGGIYEVLCVAERIAIESGMLKEEIDDYSILCEERFKKLFSEYSMAVGSTGNLGLSIGIMSAKLGFSVTVHMSADAKQWKKDLLREKGATVVEYMGNYEKAVEEGRRLAIVDPRCHFVDDENSKTLFLGYAVAAERLKKQLEASGIEISAKRPLYVYLPCGVGGGPGGVAYGLDMIYGDSLRAVFAEPVEAPCMLLGVMTGYADGICAQDIGLSGKTIADGLAVSRASRLVCNAVGNKLHALYSVLDSRMVAHMRLLHKSEGIFVEPSAAAGFAGFTQAARDSEKDAVHIVWATGGSMVPENEKSKYLA